MQSPPTRFGKFGAVACQSTSEWNARPDLRDQPIDEVAAVDVQAIRQQEHASQIFSAQSSSDCFAATSRLPRVRDILVHQPQLC